MRRDIRLDSWKFSMRGLQQMTTPSKGMYNQVSTPYLTQAWKTTIFNNHLKGWGHPQTRRRWFCDEFRADWRGLNGCGFVVHFWSDPPDAKHAISKLVLQLQLFRSLVRQRIETVTMATLNLWRRICKHYVPESRLPSWTKHFFD